MAITRSNDRIFLGGADLEMQTIRDFAAGMLGRVRITDKALGWGARASAYADEIRAALDRGETPVLIELDDDLPADIPRDQLVFIDHHGARAGADTPSSLRQLFLRLGCPEHEWTRALTLVEANDIGHIQALRDAGANAMEIVAIRDRDRAAQGIGADVEADARRAVAKAEQHGSLTIVTTSAPTASAITDFIQLEFGGPGADNLLVLSPETISFFGDGRVVKALARFKGSWHGGALPERGFWGSDARQAARRKHIVRRVHELVRKFANRTHASGNESSTNLVMTSERTQRVSQSR